MRRIAALMIGAAGSHAPMARRQLRTVAANGVLQAVAYTLLVPLLRAVVRSGGAGRTPWVLLGVFGLVLVAEEATGVRAVQFGFEQLPAVTAELRLRVGEQLRTMPAQELGRRRPGELAELLGGTLVTAVMGISTMSSRVLQLIVVPALIIVVVAVVDWRLGLVLMIVGLLAIPLGRRIQATWNWSYHQVGAADAEASARVVEYTQGLAVFKATGQLGTQARRLEEALAHQDRTMSASFLERELPGLIAGTLSQLAVVGVVVLGAILALRGEIALATVLAVVTITVRFAEPFSRALTLTALFEATEVGMGQINDLLSIRALPSPVSPRRPERFDISFEEVGFAYDSQSAPTLDRVSFTVAAHSFTALVGASGGGKTTITRLVMRNADPQTGVVRIGGVDVRDIDQVDLMSCVTAVFQDVFLFDDTIAENIRMGRPGAADADVVAAAQAANCHDFVAGLPDGYQTMVGELGGRLSGGERQRLSIARAILKNAPIVLLDEPTAALDAESELAVQQAIDHLVADHTIIAIAHRLSTIVAADQILVVEHGRVVERGTHDELLVASEGLYAAMWASQQKAGRWKIPT